MTRKSRRGKRRRRSSSEEKTEGDKEAGSGEVGIEAQAVKGSTDFVEVETKNDSDENTKPSEVDKACDSGILTGVGTSDESSEDKSRSNSPSDDLEKRMTWEKNQL